MTTPRTGRPPLPDGEARDRVLQCRLRTDELERLRAGAEADGLTLSDWMREQLLSAATKSLSRSKKKGPSRRQGIQPRSKKDT